VEMDKASLIYKNPKQNYTKALLAAIPKGEVKNTLTSLV
jgi:ABC-type oligopeptide transport system ATPase subunit